MTIYIYKAQSSSETRFVQSAYKHIGVYLPELSQQIVAFRSEAKTRHESRWNQQHAEAGVASSKVFTESSCGATPSTSPSSSPAPSSASGLWILEFISCGSTIMSGNDMRTSPFWGKDQLMSNFVSTLLFSLFQYLLLIPAS